MADVIVLNEIDSAKQELSTQIGTTTNTGGTTTAGTLMAKLNALLTSWTSIRAGYVDTIKTNVNNLPTNISNLTASVAKQAYYKLIASNTVQKAIISSTTTIGVSANTTLGTFTCGSEGIIRLSVNQKTTNSNGVTVELYKTSDLATVLGTITSPAFGVTATTTLDVTIEKEISYTLIATTGSNGSGELYSVNVCGTFVELPKNAIW